MLMSVDGYVEDEHGRFDWAAPDEVVGAGKTGSSRIKATAKHSRSESAKE